jgi:hypothetical protein
VQTTRHLYTSTMYPFSALQLTLLCWQTGEQVDQGLSDSNTKDDDGLDDGDMAQPSIGFHTEAEYNTYVWPPTLPRLYTNTSHIPAAVWRRSMHTMHGLVLSYSSNAFRRWSPG